MALLAAFITGIVKEALPFAGLFGIVLVIEALAKVQFLSFSECLKHLLLVDRGIQYYLTCDTL